MTKLRCRPQSISAYGGYRSGLGGFDNGFIRRADSDLESPADSAGAIALRKFRMTADRT